MGENFPALFIDRRYEYYPIARHKPCSTGICRNSATRLLYYRSRNRKIISGITTSVGSNPWSAYGRLVAMVTLFRHSAGFNLDG